MTETLPEELECYGGPMDGLRVKTSKLRGQPAWEGEVFQSLWKPHSEERSMIVWEPVGNRNQSLSEGRVHYDLRDGRLVWPGWKNGWVNKG